MSDDAEICGCNGVCKGVIARAITGRGLTSLDDVRAQTKASASCGQCTSKVEALLAVTLGDGKRMLVKGGKLNKTYQITVPEEMDAVQ